MIVNTGFAGLRLSMAREGHPFSQSQSIQLYSGITAKLMIFFKKAHQQHFINSTGQICSYAINKKSLAHYVWRNNRCVDGGSKNYDEEMESLYRISHRRFSKNYKVHQSYIRDTTYSLSQRSGKDRIFKFQEFVEFTKKLAPLRGYFYKIKKDNQTVGYLLGSMHAGNELFCNLNNPIRKAIRKSSVIAGEEKIDTIGKIGIKIQKDLESKSEVIFRINSQIMSAAGMGFKYGLEKMIVKFIEDSKVSKKLVSLETEEEKEYSVNLAIRESKNPSKVNIESAAQELSSIFRTVLSGKKVNLENKNDSSYRDLIERNHKMAERTIPYLGKERALIVVGADHLYEDFGMINILESKGYRFYKK